VHMSQMLDCMMCYVVFALCCVQLMFD
jgi:hypothetical protein